MSLGSIVSSSALIIALSAFSALAASENVADDNFITSSINAVFDKVNQYTSGEKGIVLDNWRGTGKENYPTDALGRRIPEPVIRTKPAASAVTAADEKAGGSDAEPSKK